MMSRTLSVPGARSAWALWLREGGFVLARRIGASEVEKELHLCMIKVSKGA
jgi:hypothetical protein